MFERVHPLAFKLRVPRVTQPILERPRLYDMLARGLRKKLTLVAAPPGFGKTTLVAAWVSFQLADAADAPRVAWVSLEADDNVPLRFWRYVLTALDKSVPGCAETALAALTSPSSPPLEEILSMLIDTLHTQERRVVLILDDFHHVTDPVIGRALMYLLEHLPEALHVTLLSRSEPGIALARLRAHRQVSDLGPDDLRCTLAEARVFLDEVAGRALPQDLARELNDRAEGWLVGLQLLALSLQNDREEQTLLNELRGTQRFVLDYLMDEVLRRQPEEMQQFLLRTSVLERLNASLCDAVLERSDSQLMLLGAEQRQLFLVALDQGRTWFRLHTLFREALLSRLALWGPELPRALHARASDWFATSGDLFAAVAHAVRADRPTRAVELLAAVPAEQMMDSTFAPALLDWFKQLPSDLVYDQPTLWWPYITWLLYNSQHLKADRWLEGLHQRLQDETRTLPGLPREQRVFLQGILAANRATVAGLSGDGPRARELAEHALQTLRDDADPGRFLAFGALSVAALIDGRLRQASDLTLEAATSAEQGGQHKVALVYGVTGALYQYWDGRPRDAYATLEQFVEVGGPPLILDTDGYSGVILALLLYEANDLDAALTSVRQGIHLAEQRQFTQTLEMGYHALACVSLALGDYSAAHLALEQLSPVMQGNAFRRTLLITSVQVKLWCAAGQVLVARHWAEHLDNAARPESRFARAVEDVARARVWLVCGEPHRALEVLDGLKGEPLLEQMGGVALDVHVLTALAYGQRQEPRAALEALSMAVRRGEAQRQLRPFLDQGAPMLELLTRLQREGAPSVSTSYLRDLHHALSGAVMPTPPGSAGTSVQQERRVEVGLSARELETLTLLARGLSNADAARLLNVSVHTVKSHVRSVLSKLNAQNRTQAVAQARARGLLSRDE